MSTCEWTLELKAWISGSLEQFLHRIKILREILDCFKIHEWSEWEMQEHFFPRMSWIFWCLNGFNILKHVDDLKCQKCVRRIIKLIIKSISWMFILFSPSISCHLLEVKGHVWYTVWSVIAGINFSSSSVNHSNMQFFTCTIETVVHLCIWILYYT